MKNVTCFINYSWDSDDHRAWVIELASELQRNGVLTYVDAWDVKPALDLMEYMETNNRECDFVLLVCTPEFARKANAGQGGVGYEKRIVTGEIYHGAASPKKFVPILRKGDPTVSLPSYLKSRVYIDFRDDQLFHSRVEELLRHLLDKPKYKRPPLGTTPSLPPHDTAEPIKAPQPAKKSRMDTFKEVYEYARSYSGLGKIPSEAEKFAEMWVNQYYDKDFERFKEVYEYARSYSGLGKIPSEAEKFALKHISAE